MSGPLHIVCPHCDAVNRIPPDKLDAHPRCGKCHQPLFNGAPLALDTARFQRHLERSGIPLLVDFWAEWCGPCKMMAPVFEQAARQLEPGMRLIKVDTDREQALASSLGIRAIPTLILFRSGREVARTSGATNLQGLLAWVRQHLG